MTFGGLDVNEELFNRAIFVVRIRWIDTTDHHDELGFESEAFELGDEFVDVVGFGASEGRDLDGVYFDGGEFADSA